MTKLTNLINTLGEKNFEIANDKIKQTERNALKKDFLDTLLETLTDNGFDAERTNDGVVIVLQANRTIYIAIDAVVKNLDYDIDFETAEYETKIAKQVERELERQKKAESKK